MLFAIDLHIHSALSPCCDDDMTPNNIVNMSKLKGLDIIAITDHNTTGNLLSVIECGKKAGLLVIPGIEVETREEIHCITLFPSIESAYKIDEIIKSRFNGLKNREDIFGAQLFFDSEDNVIGKEENMLISAVDISINELNDITKKFGGVMIPAHVDRDSYSVLTNLGGVPDELKLKFLELSVSISEIEFIKTHPELSPYKFIQSSDAHHLWDIRERECFIELEKCDSAELIKKLTF
jgi:PHP family Zn ribbon phosphoesterase